VTPPSGAGTNLALGTQRTIFIITLTAPSKLFCPGS
jgi:hypothetical protein